MRGSRYGSRDGLERFGEVVAPTRESMRSALLSEADVFALKLEVMHAVFACALASRDPSGTVYAQAAAADGGGAAAAGMGVDAWTSGLAIATGAEQMAGCITDHLRRFASKALQPCAQIALEAARSVSKSSTSAAAGSNAGLTGSSNASAADASAVSACCGVCESRMTRPRRVSAVGAALARLRVQLSMLEQGCAQLVWLHGDQLTVTEAGASAGQRRALLVPLRESFEQTSSAITAAEDAQRRHLDVRERIGAAMAAALPQEGRGGKKHAVHSASALEQSMGLKAAVEQLQQLSSSDDARFSTTVQRVRQLSTVAEVVLRLEGLRDIAGDGSGAVLEETVTCLGRLQVVCAQETSLRRAVHHQTAVLSALQVADDPRRGAIDHAIVLQTSQAALQLTHSECITRIEEAQAHRIELERLVADGGAMGSEATALIDELETLGRSAEDLETGSGGGASNRRAGVAAGGGASGGSHSLTAITRAAGELRGAWGATQERMVLLSTGLLPRVLQLSSKAEDITLLIPEGMLSVLGGGGLGGGYAAAALAGMAEDEHLDVFDRFIQSTRGAASTLHPMVASLGSLVAAAADGGGGAANGGDADDASAEANGADAAAAADGMAVAEVGGDGGGMAVVDVSSAAEAGAVAIASESSARPASATAATSGKGQKQERNVHALTVLRRIKCKLDGKDRWPGKEREIKQSVAEQVDTVIRQAVSPDNLCLMFEGWSSWT